MDNLENAWEAGLRAGMEYERNLWKWQAGPMARAVNGLTERPTKPKNPYLSVEEDA